MECKLLYLDTLPAEVSVATMEISSDTGALIAQATPQDMLDIARVKSISRQAEMLATRKLIRQLFGAEAILAHHPDGSPFVPALDLNISISHCQGLVAIATHPDKRIGIDIERWRPTLAQVKEKFLTPQEIDIYNTPTLLLHAWTAKEAAYKATGHPGLPLHSILLPDNIPGTTFTTATPLACIVLPQPTPYPSTATFLPLP